MKLSIVIPAYNEEKRIKDTLVSYLKYFDSIKRQKKLNYEILVVINGTTDSTPSIVKSIASKNKSLRYLNLVNGGKGYAIKEGFKESLKNGFDLIGFVDADMSTSPEEYYNLVQFLKGFVGVIASRYVKGANVYPKPTLQRKIASRVFNSLIRALLFMPYRDTQCGAKVFSARAIKKVTPTIGITQWAFDVELLYNLRKLGFVIKEVPTTWSDKEYSKVNLSKAGPWMALAIIRLRLLNSPLKKLVRLYDFLLGLIK